LAIVTISRIQHRRGYYENLPQLSAAELGWAIDERRLFIGNGPTSEGAPEIGNTEILTEYSDILDISKTYTFKNADAGYTPTTGPSANDPTIRTLQQKLDDFVSVKDFGAKGDGETDDTDAINRALFELYCREEFEGARKKLYMPAGRYMISEWIKVPPYASIIGEGPSNTVIVQTADVSDFSVIFKTCDSKQQVDGAIGTNNATLPQDIFIADLGLETNLDAFYIDKTRRMTISRVKVTGPDDLPTTDVSIATALLNPIDQEPSTGIWISGSNQNPSEDINIIDCYFTKLNFGVWQDLGTEEFQNVIISSATFDNMYQGIYIGISGGTCKNFIVTNSVFHNIYAQAINVNSISEFVSSFNYYKDVANNYQGTGNPASPVISFGTSALNCASMGDLFDRTNLDAEIFPIIENNPSSSYYNYGEQVAIGYLKTKNGRRQTLFDNLTDAPTDVVVNKLKDNNLEILYNCTRGTDRRFGKLTISFDTTGIYSIDDDSTETADIGVTFDVDIVGNEATLTYTTTNTGDDVEMDYSIRNLSEYVV